MIRASPNERSSVIDGLRGVASAERIAGVSVPAQRSEQPRRVALVEYGYWGRNVARAINGCSQTNLVWVVDVAQQCQEAARSAYPWIRVSADLDHVLNTDEVDGVVLATPSELHAGQAVQVLRRGLPVFVEKPIALSADGASHVVRAAEQSGAVVMVGHTFLYAESVRVLKSVVTQGRLGGVQSIESVRLGLGRPRADCDVVWSLGPHDVSILLYLTDDHPSTVRATALPVDGGVGFYEADVMLGFNSGLRCRVRLSATATRKTRLVTVRGTSGTAYFDAARAGRPLWIEGGVSPAHCWTPALDGVEPLVAEMAAFAQACVTGAPPLSDAVLGYEVVRLLEAVDHSAQSGGVQISLAW